MEQRCRTVGKADRILQDDGGGLWVLLSEMSLPQEKSLFMLSRPFFTPQRGK